MRTRNLRLLALFFLAPILTTSVAVAQGAAEETTGSTTNGMSTETPPAATTGKGMAGCEDLRGPERALCNITAHLGDDLPVCTPGISLPGLKGVYCLLKDKTKSDAVQKASESGNRAIERAEGREPEKRKRFWGGMMKEKKKGNILKEFGDTTDAQHRREEFREERKASFGMQHEEMKKMRKEFHQNMQELREGQREGFHNIHEGASVLESMMMERGMIQGDLRRLHAEPARAKESTTSITRTMRNKFTARSLDELRKTLNKENRAQREKQSPVPVLRSYRPAE